MANVTKVRVGSTEYDIKDTTARADATEAKGNISETKGNVAYLNSSNLRFFSGTFTGTNITVTSDNDDYNYHVTSNDSSVARFVDLHNSTSDPVLPAEKTTYVTLLCDNPCVYVRFFTYTGETATALGNAFAGKTVAFKPPAGVTGTIVRVYVRKGCNANDDFALMFSDEKPNSELANNIDGLKPFADSAVYELATMSDFYERGSYNSTTNEFDYNPTGNNFSTTYIRIDPTMFYGFYPNDHLAALQIFDASKNYLFNVSAAYADCFTCSRYAAQGGNNAAYAMIRIHKDYLKDASFFKIGEKDRYERATGREIVDSKGIKQTWTTTRRPLVGFILDGDYDLNEDMHDVFAANNTVCGFASRRAADYGTPGILKYLQWQKDGFEILVHGNADVGPDTTLTDAEVIASIQESFERLYKNGFCPKGYVALQGNCDVKWIPYIQKYFDWAATMTNTSGSGEPCIFFGQDKPYRLFRYSMQQSTLAEMKAAVDRCLAQNALLLFYGHAQSGSSLGNFTTENLDALIKYVKSKKIDILRPTDAVLDFFTVRYEDVMSLMGNT